MYNKKYILSSVLVGIALSLALVAPALVSASMAPANFQGGMMGHRPMMPGISGTVSVISGSTLTVVNSKTNTTYSVDASSATINKSGTTSSLSAISVGDTVMVQGTLSGTNVTAKMIFDGMGSRMFSSGIMGTVASMSGSNLTVTSKARPNATTTTTPTTYSVDASSATVTKNGTASSVGSISVGDTVMVQGTVTGTNVVAKTIRDGMMQGMGIGNGQQNPVIQGNGQPIVAGSVTAISGNTITITNKSNVTYTIDATNAKIQEGKAIGTISSVAVGDNVVVQGAVNGNSVTASLVIDQKAPTVSNNTTQKPPMNFMGGIVNFFKHMFGF